MVARTLDEAVRALRKVRCSACKREFLSNTRAPHVCPSCKRIARLVLGVRKLKRIR